MAGAYILGCEGPALTAAEASFFRAADPWGFILFQRNIESKAQVSALTAALREAVGRDAPVLIDQEGGRVQRMWPPVWHQHPPALDMCEAAADVERAMYLRGRLIAAELYEIGIDVNCAPLGDIADDTTHPRLLNRCYGTDAASVATRGRALTDGQLAGGVLPVLKHIPGHGSSTKDSHVDLPVVTRSAEELSARDFAPFKALSDLPMGMTAHLIFQAYDGSLPATTSPTMHRVIREEIGFGGLLMTDDLSMEALSGSVTDRCRAALGAGCDLILHCNGELPEMEEVAAFGAMTPEATKRAEAALSWRKAPDNVDIAALTREFRTLTEGTAP
ncbi:MAG: beta-N-acetylhexosaminidase [Pseudomonadota bacterium]